MLLDPEGDRSLISTLMAHLHANMKKSISEGKVQDNTKAAIQYWSSLKSPYDMFKDVARMVFSAQATSVASECAFSTSGNVMTHDKPQLKPSQVNRMSCLRHNVDKASIDQFLDNFCDHIKTKGLTREENLEQFAKEQKMELSDDDEPTGVEEDDFELIEFQADSSF
jgi:hypothetical protein